MGLFSWLYSLIILFFFFFVTSLSSPSPPPLCHPHESSALLHFRNSFTLYNDTLFSIEFRRINNPNNTISWNKNMDCCRWSGVTCDEVTAHVIRLDLTCSDLQGILHSNNTLFSLAHLQSLILSHNLFDDSEISSQFGKFSNMVHLDLSHSGFTGHAPLELSHLSNLVTLDLSGNDRLILDTSSWKRTVANLTSLGELFLSGVNMSSTSPDSFMNLSTSLTSLDLSWSSLQGKLPENVLSLPNLQQLDLSHNLNLNWSFPQYNWSSPLKVLNLSESGVMIDLPHLCRKLKYLHILSLRNYNFLKLSPTLLDNRTQITSLDLSFNNFGGYIPWSSILNLQQLTYLDLSGNNFVGPIPEICSNSTKNSFSCVSSKHQLVSSPPLNLKYLHLSDNELNGTIPSWFYSLPSLQYLDLNFNKFSGSIKEFQHNSLVSLYLDSNNLQGSFPRSIFQQVNLSSLNLFSNNLSGVVQFDQFSKLKKLQVLALSNNSLSLVSNNNNNDTLPNTLSHLYLSSCGISEFPYSLRSLENLRFLDLSNNQIEGSVPQWLWNMGNDSLYFLDISHNSLTQIDHIPWKNLEYIILSSNRLQGHLPIPPPYTIFFSISNNTLFGEIPHLICNLNILQVLDLSNNNLSGNIPPCLGKSSLSVLDLHKNKFHGNIPSHFAKESFLQILNLNENQLEGSLPKSMLNCKDLEFLDIGNNKINGSFPWWLESLPNLQVLILRSNRFQGLIGNPKVRHPFQNLRIIDLSGNEFTGHFPQKYFKNFVGMMNATSDSLRYMEAHLGLSYYEIREIPELLGKLSSLKGLNFSHNKISGSIPPSLGNLTNLEWLDLSSNELVGKIPWQLAANLNQLQFLNLSSNKFEGLIPRSRQFDTFTNDSYKENLGLCGFPISESCNENTTPQVQQEDNEEHVNGFDWKIVLMGFGSGMVIGISVGYMFLSDKIIDGLVKTVKGEQWHLLPKRSKQRRARQNLIIINAHLRSLKLSVGSTQKQLENGGYENPTSVLVSQLEEDEEEGRLETGFLEFLTTKGKMLFNSIVELPLDDLNGYFDSVKVELVEVDLISLLKALDLSGNWERSLLLFEWVLSNLWPAKVKLNSQVIELMVRILGRESQHTIASKLFDEISLDEFSLDIRENSSREQKLVTENFR
ncbi:receptor-like protein 6 [Humulus lupulus]|uniref:receptor-like protein 6 n=1 Tax=Humulus lupulus TaxID=3486 RepID=UPI002B4177C6|nr:receptor-like protein 6 [Humulus lupulus]